MKNKKTSAILIALFLASIMDLGFSVVTVSASNGNIVVNGGFEQLVVTHSSNWDIYASIPGWSVEWMPTVTDPDRPPAAFFELQNETNGRKAFEGLQWTELDSDWDGPEGALTGEPASVAIYQNLMTVPGGVYRLSFAYSPRPNEAKNNLTVRWGGAVVDDISASGGSTLQWTLWTGALTATSSTTQLRFEEAGPANSRGMFLDGVSVTLMEIESCDSTGKRKDEFNPTESVYANGSGFKPTTTYDIYVVKDEATWSYGTTLNDETEGVTQATTDSNGNIQPTRVWEFAVPGKYDIVVDCDNSQTYSPGDVIDDSDIKVTAGFFVIPEYPLGTILGLAMCFAALALYKSRHIHIRINNS